MAKTGSESVWSGIPGRGRASRVGGMLTSQVWLQLGEHYQLVDEPPDGTPPAGASPLGAMLSAVCSSTVGNIGRIVNLLEMPVRSVQMSLRGRLDEGPDGPRLVSVERDIEAVGDASQSQLDDLVTTAQNCATWNTVANVVEIEPASMEVQGAEAPVSVYLPPAGTRPRVETEVWARSLDDHRLAYIRVGDHTIVIDESATARPHVGAWSVGLCMGSFYANVYLSVRRAAANAGIPIKGLEVKGESRTDRQYGTGPRHPSGSEPDTFWGRVALVRPKVLLWGTFTDAQLETLQQAALTGPVARTFVSAVTSQDRISQRKG